MRARELLRSALWAALLVAGGALAQEAAISGAEFTGGKADAQLGAIGKQAAASGKTVVITAPGYWQAKAAAKVRAGAHGKPVTIVFSNGFYENVLVRTEASAPKPEAAAKPEAKAVEAKAKPRPEPKIATAEPRPVMPQPKPQTRTAPKPMASAPRLASEPVPQPRAAPMPAQTPPPQRAPNIVAVPQVSQQPSVVPIPTMAANSTGVKPALPSMPATANSERGRLLIALNDGRPAAGELHEAQLQSGDQIYSDGDTLAAVRLEGLRRSLYWLTGTVDLQRVQYSPMGNGRYQVVGSIDPKVLPAHRSDRHVAQRVAARVPAANDASRTRLEQQYNSGQPITDSLRLGQLQPEDRLLVEGNAILVVRREGDRMARYWLDGPIDLGQSGVRKIDSNLYQVVGSVR